MHGTTQLLNFDAPGCHEDRLDDVGVKEWAMIGAACGSLCIIAEISLPSI